MARRVPFDPEEPFDAIAESVRRATVEVIVAHQKVALFKDLHPGRQLEAIIAGSMTAILGVALIYTEREHRDEIEQVIRDFVSAARANAEEMAEIAISEAE